jgi:hypothetical protein
VLHPLRNIHTTRLDPPRNANILVSRAILDFKYLLRPPLGYRVPGRGLESGECMDVP